MNSVVVFNSAAFPVTPLCVSPSSEYASLWSETLGSPEVCVAILDGMADLRHLCLVGADLAALSSAPLARASSKAPSMHGTHVASIVFGQHDTAVRGIAPRCRRLVILVFESTKDGGVLPCSQTDLARAITLAVRNGANVINISGGNGAATRALVFALGQIDFDFGSDSVRDSFQQQGVKVPDDPDQMMTHLTNNPSDATGVIWTLVQEATPIYAIQPSGAFAMEMYAEIRGFMKGPLEGVIGQVSVPGRIAGKLPCATGTRFRCSPQNYEACSVGTSLL